MNTTTVASLRPVLADYFGRTEVDTALRVLRLAGLIPEGQSGHGGCRSARLTPEQCALCILALASNAKDTSAEAQRIAGFVWVAVDHTHASEEPRREAGNHVLRLVDYLAQALDGPLDEGEPLGWYIDNTEASQAAPDRMVFSGPGGPHSGVQRTIYLPGRLIGDIAELFAQPAAPAKPAERAA
jgi:hypothetical protein